VPGRDGEERRYRVEPAPAREGADGGDERPRLDAFVAARDEALSRAQVQRLIEDGDVLVNGAVPAKAGIKLRPGDEVLVRIRPPVAIEVAAEAIELVVLHEDRHLIVIDKPAGMVVHPAPGHSSGTLVNALLAHCTDLAGIGGELRPGIVHRLDKDTTGVLVAAKDEATLQALSAAFKAKTRVLREYRAVLAPSPAAAAGTIRTLYGRHPVDRKRFSSKVATGKHAVTHWEIAERLIAGAALVRCRLETGRTHQIRVHMADSGWPLIGDRTYGRSRLPSPLGEAADELGRQALHAARLELDHPITGERLRFATEPPADFQRLLARLRPAT
jgi:23S rRNA pseudouridine1911/1915/1917 synthase